MHCQFTSKYIILDLGQSDNGTTSQKLRTDSSQTTEQILFVLRIALAQCLPALRNILIKRHLEDRPVIVVLGHLTD